MADAVISAHPPTDMWSQGTGDVIVEPLSEPVCVVIADDDIAEEEVRRRLGNSLPLRVVSWGDHSYLAAIRDLRPAAIVVLGADEKLVHDQCRLVASLFSSCAATVISATMTEAPSRALHLLVQQLGTGAAAQIASLSDLQLP